MVYKIYAIAIKYFIFFLCAANREEPIYLVYLFYPIAIILVMVTETALQLGSWFSSSVDLV